MEELGITSISSHSPQARGRIERLVIELRLAGAEDIINAPGQGEVIKRLRA